MAQPLVCEAIRASNKRDERCCKPANYTISGHNFCGLHKSGNFELFAETESALLVKQQSAAVDNLKKDTKSSKSKKSSSKSVIKSKGASASVDKSSKHKSVKKRPKDDTSHEEITRDVGSVKKTKDKKSKSKEDGGNEKSTSKKSKSSKKKKDDDDDDGIQKQTVKMQQKDKEGQPPPPKIMGDIPIINVIDTEAEDRGARRKMEDIVATFELKSPSVMAPGLCKLFMVCDGHGGKRAAQWTIDNFIDIFCRFLKNNPTVPILKICQDAHLANSDGWNDYARKNGTGGEDLTDGSTFLWAFLHMGSGTLWVNNCGDSRAIACRNGKHQRITKDHKPTDPDELRRLKIKSAKLSQKSGGKYKIEITHRQGDDARVNKILAMSRSIGDLYPEMHGNDVLERRADVFEIDVSKGSWDIVMATDGVWDIARNSEVARQLASSPDYGAKELIAYCKMKPNLSDNLSAIIIRISPISSTTVTSTSASISTNTNNTVNASTTITQTSTSHSHSRSSKSKDSTSIN